MPTSASAPRLQDLLLAVLFIGMAIFTPEHDPTEIVLILLLGALQITESRFIPIDTVRGKIIWNGAKLVAGYLLIGFTEGVQSTFYLVLLFPVISAAATMGVISTLAFTGLACSAYASFLLFVDWNRFDILQDQIDELVRRLLFLAIAGLLVNTLAEALREQSIRYRLVGEQLAESNRNLREAERQVRRAERLAALGQLTAGLAHELRNPLGTIKASAEMLDRNLPQSDEIARELAGYISSEVDRTNSLVSRFLDFARPLELRSAEADLERVIGSAVSATRRDAEKSGIFLVNAPAEIPVSFFMDAELMERVFVNLIMNAIQASAPGGTVTVQSRKTDQTAVVTVEDHGAGIQPESMESIFNPFFTTKSDGTGLGLAIVAKIVDEHGGTINVQSTPGQKTIFTVTLPMKEST